MAAPFLSTPFQPYVYQGSAADVAMCAMLQISRNERLKELGWKLLLQVRYEVILEGPSESAEVAKAIVVECMSKPFFDGVNFLKVDLSVDAKTENNWKLHGKEQPLKARVTEVESDTGAIFTAWFNRQ